MKTKEKQTILAFICEPKRDRYLAKMASEKYRETFLDCLNHCRDIDSTFSLWLPSNADIVGILRKEGAPAECNIIAADHNIDGKRYKLAEGVEAAQQSEWATIICCIPDCLAFYLDECGERRALLKRDKTATRQGYRDRNAPCGASRQAAGAYPAHNKVVVRNVAAAPSLTTHVRQRESNRLDP